MESNKEYLKKYKAKYPEKYVEYNKRRKIVRKLNPEKLKEQNKRYADSNPLTPIHRKNGQLKRNYGITIEDFNKMFDEQLGHCAICGKHQTELGQSLCVDHNHDTGKVRGLLCINCNAGLGNFKDDSELVFRALEYLENRNG